MLLGKFFGQDESALGSRFQTPAPRSERLAKLHLAASFEGRGDVG
jgi:hypothetical protein